MIIPVPPYEDPDTGKVIDLNMQELVLRRRFDESLLADEALIPGEVADLMCQGMVQAVENAIAKWRKETL